VVVHYLGVVGISVTPHKTKMPLAVCPDVDPYTVLPFPMSAQGFQTVPRRCCQIAQLRRFLSGHEVRTFVEMQWHTT
jgi:hypothetical protein